MSEVNPKHLKLGLCGNRGDHDPHEHESSTLGLFWCHADQSKREPHNSEQRRAIMRKRATRGH